MQPRYIRPSAPGRGAASTADPESSTETNSEKPVKNSEKRVGSQRRIETPAEKPIQKPIEFRLNLPGAKSATVAGTFNEWDLNRTPLSKDPNGGWKTTVLLKPGRYEYRFVIDGAQWYSDPGARDSVPNGFGSTNSVVVV